jgi:hypothetical protein
MPEVESESVSTAVRSLRFTFAVAILFGAAAISEAHEIGTTQVTVHLHVASLEKGGTYSIDVVTDADALLEKLETMANRPGPKPAAIEFATRLAALEDTFRDRVTINFDGVIVRPTIDFHGGAPERRSVPVGGHGPAQRRRATGRSRFVWDYSWTFADGQGCGERYARSVRRLRLIPTDQRERCRDDEKLTSFDPHVEGGTVWRTSKTIWSRPFSPAE